jgi:hypothetical protein
LQRKPNATFKDVQNEYRIADAKRERALYILKRLPLILDKVKAHAQDPSTQYEYYAAYKYGTKRATYKIHKYNKYALHLQTYLCTLYSNQRLTSAQAARLFEQEKFTSEELIKTDDGYYIYTEKGILRMCEAFTAATISNFKVNPILVDPFAYDSDTDEEELLAYNRFYKINPYKKEDL